MPLTGAGGEPGSSGREALVSRTDTIVSARAATWPRRLDQVVGFAIWGSLEGVTEGMLSPGLGAEVTLKEEEQ